MSDQREPNTPHPNVMRALGVIIQDATSDLTDKERVMLLLSFAHAEYHKSGSIDSDFIDLYYAMDKVPEENYNYDDIGA